MIGRKSLPQFRQGRPACREERRRKAACVNSGAQRYTFGIPELSDGLGVASVAMGLFGIAEIMLNLQVWGNREIIGNKVSGLWLTKSQFTAAWPAALRGTGLGSVLGLLPGGGAMLASFTSYAVEKKLGGNQGQFGNGAIQGVAGPEAANNAGAQAASVSDGLRRCPRFSCRR